jgi:hypothetical protein
MNNQQLEDVKYHKHLGVAISDDGSWNKHIELVIDKAYSRLNITIQLAFLPYRPYLITIRLVFLPYFPYLFTIQLTFLP